MHDQFTEIRDLFLAAIERDGVDAQLHYAEEQCAEKPQVHAQLVDMLKAHHRTADFLASGVEATHNMPVSTEAAGTRFGPYKVRELLGEGGMGSVYVAEQEEPVRRKVALKIIKPGMDSRQVIARFDAERHVLALMDHPHIARVLDAGTTEAGRPYFVMELVRGVPITEFCDKRNLTTRERLELFVKVCLAVQHAHQKGIIHRDIKPSNVLVTLHDDLAVPKVIDFGIAKATSQLPNEHSVYTGFSQMLGTPLYMSPEQAEMNALDIDTRSDVYSLGVLMYELITGITPFDSETLKRVGFDEMRRLIREQEPPRPSERLSTLNAEARSTVSQRRGVDAGKLDRTLRGELDWIVMKALEKDRNRRYESASAFAADVQRYLTDEPVEACPPSASYRLRKFVQRNKGSVSAGFALAVLLVLGTVGTSIGLSRALRAERTATLAAESESRQRRDAETQRDRAEAAEKRATEEAEIAKAVNDFLQNDLLAEAAPDKNARKEKVTVEEVLGRAAARIANKFDQQPLIEAAIRQTIGNTYRELGDYASAQPHLERALEIRRRLLPVNHSGTLESMNDLAVLYSQLELYSRAESLHLETLEIHRCTSGAEHIDTIVSMNNLASLYHAQGLYTRAEPLLTNVLEVSRRVLGEDHYGTLRCMMNLGSLYRDMGQLAKAEQLHVQQLEVTRRVLGAEHSHTLVSMANLASLYLAQDQDAKAEPLLTNALEVSRRVLGEEHPHTLIFMCNLAAAYLGQNQFVNAEPLLVRALEISRRTLGEEHSGTLGSMNNLATVYMSQGRYSDAELLYVETLEIRRRVLGQEHPLTLLSADALAFLYLAQGEDSRAEPLYSETLELRRRILGQEHPDTLVSMHNVGSLYRFRKQFAEARLVLTETLECRRKVLGADHTRTLTTMNKLALVFQDQFQFVESEVLLRECLKISEQSQPEHWRTFNTKSMLGGALQGQKKYGEAETLLLTGYQGLASRSDTIPAHDKPCLAEALERLVQLYEALGNPDLAEQWRSKESLPLEASHPKIKATKK